MDSKLEDNILEHKKNKYHYACTNCGKMGHDYKNCDEPITSWGIILVKLTDPNNIEHKKHFDKLNDITNTINNGIHIHSKDDLEKIGYYSNSILFLLVTRKHSLGYIEFIRGKYKLDNINGIIFLFQQMIPSEIERIKNAKDYDDLWSDFFDDTSKKITYQKEFIDGKIKYEKLKNKIDVELPLSFYINNIKSHYDTQEVGFGKGRRKRGETDLECAIREFCEETGMTQQDFKIITNIKPIVENMTGTNGIKYRHIYYVAEAISDKCPKVDPTNEIQYIEISNVDYYTYYEAYELIRDYHVEKRKIITNVFMYYLDLLVNKTRQTIEFELNNKKNETKSWDEDVEFLP